MSIKRYLNESFNLAKTNTLLHLEILNKPKDNFDHDIEKSFNNIINLIYKGMIDFSLINDFLIMINMNSHVRTLNNVLLGVVTKKLRETKKNLKVDQKLEDYYHLVNLFIFLMIFTLNIESKDLLRSLFKKGQEFSYQFFKAAKRSFVFETQNEIIKILNFFYSTEYLSLFLKSDCKSIYDYITYKTTKYKDLLKRELKYNTRDYNSLIMVIINLDLNYSSLFTNKNLCLEEDKLLLRSLLCQSLIRILFSNEIKNSFNHIYPIGEENYENMIISNLVSKCIYHYKNIFGEKTNCLFRREEIHDDLLKSILFMFGHSLFNNIYSILNKIIVLNKVDPFKKEDFTKFFYLLIEEISLSVPYIIKLILKYIYLKVESIYKVVSYEPVFVFLFFNFLFNPKVQEMNGINISTNSNLKDINLLINNICFNKKFKSEDKLSIYNDIIEDLNKDLCDTFKDLFDFVNVEVGDEQQKKSNMKKLKTKKSIYFKELYCNELKKPIQLFWFDCDLVYRLLELEDESNYKYENFKAVYNQSKEKKLKI